MKDFVIIFLSFCFLMMFSYRLKAQETDSIRSERLAKFENIVSKLPKISGLIDFRYRYDSEKSTFDIRRARLDLQGTISKMFDYRLQVEFASSPRLLDAYARAKIKPYFNIQAGSFKLPFTLENPYSPKNLELMDNAMAITKLCSYEDLSGINSNGRDIGLMFYGGFLGKRGFNTIEYYLGIFNGAGINIRDNNKSKDIVGRIEIRPIRHLTLSASGYIGEMVLDQDHRYERRDRYAAGLRFDNSKIVFRTEYIAGLTAGIKSAGIYAVAGYTFWRKFTPALRFDVFQDDLKEKETLQLNYTIGLSYWIHRNFRCQLNYTYESFVDGSRNGSLIGAMITAAF